MDITEWRKNGYFYEDNFHSFMQEVATQAEKLQVEQKTINAYSDEIKRGRIYVPHPRKANLHDAKEYASEKNGFIWKHPNAEDPNVTQDTRNHLPVYILDAKIEELDIP